MSKMKHIGQSLYALVVLSTVYGCAASPPTGEIEQRIESIADIASQARQDAKIAIDTMDYRLLAFANRTIDLPGIDMQKHSVTLIEKQCGYRVLSGTGDMLQVGEDTTKRQKLRLYAQTYNPLVYRGCQIFQKNY